MEISTESLLENEFGFVFRADASYEMGTGHVMRILSYAEELAERGYSTTFVGDVEQSHWLVEKIALIRNLKWVKSENSYRPDTERNVLMFDSYLFSPDDPFLELEKWIAVVAIVDDNTPDYLATHYLHPGPIGKWKKPAAAVDARIFSGLEYIPIRKNLRAVFESRKVENKVPKILIVGGGTDPFEFSNSLVRLISSSAAEFEAIVFEGKRLVDSDDERFHITQIGDQFDKNLKSANFVFTTAGTSAWELIALRIPCAVALAVENQRPNYEFIRSQKLAFAVGERVESKWKFNEGEIFQILEHLSNLPMLEALGLNYPDLDGVTRFVSDLISEIEGSKFK